MTRSELEEYIFDTYGVRPDYPWDSTPSSEVFRHGDNKRWFALIMDVPKSSLDIPGGGTLCAVNLKCGPIVGGSLCGQNGFFSAAKTSLSQKHMASMKILKRVERLVNEMTKILVKMTENPGVVKPLASGAGFAYNGK